MRKQLTRLSYWLGIRPSCSRAYYLDTAGRLCYRRWLSSRDAAPLERPVAHFSSTGQLLIYQ